MKSYPVKHEHLFSLHQTVAKKPVRYQCNQPRSVRAGNLAPEVVTSITQHRVMAWKTLHHFLCRFFKFQIQVKPKCWANLLKYISFCFTLLFTCLSLCRKDQFVLSTDVELMLLIYWSRSSLRASCLGRSGGGAGKGRRAYNYFSGIWIPISIPGWLHVVWAVRFPPICAKRKQTRM